MQTATEKHQGATVKGLPATSDQVSASCWDGHHSGAMSGGDCGGSMVQEGAPGFCSCDCHKSPEWRAEIARLARLRVSLREWAQRAGMNPTDAQIEEAIEKSTPPGAMLERLRKLTAGDKPCPPCTLGQHDLCWALQLAAGLCACHAAGKVEHAPRPRTTSPAPNGGRTLPPSITVERINRAEGHLVEHSTAAAVELVKLQQQLAIAAFEAGFTGPEREAADRKAAEAVMHATAGYVRYMPTVEAIIGMVQATREASARRILDLVLPVLARVLDGP